MIRPTLLVLAAVAAIAAGCGDDGGDSPSGDGAAMTAASENAAMKDDGATKDDRAMSARRRGAVVKVVDSEYGRVIADRRGEALYLFDRERGRRARCYGACAVAWPPVLAKGRPRAGAGARQRLLGTTRRRDGRVQVTYAGHPLYYYKDDSPGTILCHDVEEFGGLWLVVEPSGRPAP